MKTLFAFVKNRVKSFYFAFAGLKDILTTEHNAWIHAIFTCFAIVLAIWLRISFMKFALIMITITLVWVAEAFNTVLEIVVNMVSPRYSKAARRAKDIAAGAVLVAAIGSVVVGLVLMGPPLLAALGVR